MRLSQRFVLVIRRTRLEELIARFNTRQQAKFYLEQSGADFADYEEEDANYNLVIGDAKRELQQRGRLQILDRTLLPNYQFAPDDIVVVIGQDGLVANTLKYLDGQSVIGVNPDSARWDGVLLPFVPRDLAAVLDATANKEVQLKSVTLAEAALNDGQKLLAVNDFFVGPASHISARYRLHWAGQSEEHSSSGVIVSTGLGSTGWFQSILAGAAGISGSFRHPELSQGFAWDSRHLYYSVREPFPSQTTGTNLVFGKVDHKRPLQLESLMPEHGVIFSDGIEHDFIPFNAGTTVRIGISDRNAALIAS